MHGFLTDSGFDGASSNLHCGGKLYWLLAGAGQVEAQRRLLAAGNTRGPVLDWVAGVCANDSAAIITAVGWSEGCRWTRCSHALQSGARGDAKYADGLDSIVGKCIFGLVKLRSWILSGDGWMDGLQLSDVQQRCHR
jgi:hypothetical protein